MRVGLLEVELTGDQEGHSTDSREPAIAAGLALGGLEEAIHGDEAAVAAGRQGRHLDLRDGIAGGERDAPFLNADIQDARDEGKVMLDGLRRVPLCQLPVAIPG